MKFVKHHIILICLVILSAVFHGCSTCTDSNANSQSDPEDSLTSLSETNIIGADTAALFRKNFKEMLKLSKPVKLPYKFRMDFYKEYDEKCAFHELLRDPFIGWSVDNPFERCYYIEGYLPDTSKFFTLLAMRSDVENEGGIITLDKNCKLISSKIIHNHSSVDDIAWSIYHDENYFTIDQGLKIHYYFHRKRAYLDIWGEIYKNEYTEGFFDAEYENRGYIDGHGNIIYDQKNEITLKEKLFDVLDAADTQMKFQISSDSTATLVKDSSYRNLNNGFLIPLKIRIDGKKYIVNCIGDSAFIGCNGLNSIVIHEYIDKIGISAFENCKNISYISLHDGLKEISPKTFYGCEKLNSIKINPGIIKIGEQAFYECSSLHGLDIPSSIEAIGSQAFANCKNLNLTIHKPEKGIVIGKDAFNGCKDVSMQK